MASICWSSISLLVLLAFPFSATLISPLLGLVALPYFLAMASDLRYCGYKRLDVLRIYGFNLVLLPVNLAGTISSIVQGITASKAPFARTPKVRNRTVVPPFFVIAPYLLIALAGATCYFAYRHDRVENMAYAALNIVLACYAVKAFIGLRNSVVDACIHATSLLYKSGRQRRGGSAARPGRISRLRGRPTGARSSKLASSKGRAPAAPTPSPMSPTVAASAAARAASWQLSRGAGCRCCGSCLSPGGRSLASATAGYIGGQDAAARRRARRSTRPGSRRMSTSR